ncbi:hypothetical protein EMCG_01748 [[Emmonsia] crescens]|uniref:Zn(2)-C6 fungal-type domain-containing protein n=1 Tax=[Emmonsia] crescens TaxID=73230 RepID=A0A0G2I038_9EURO|nr:hypothetical protein EMCG_01748 [Emmonsia crescens UAMH 3008]
MSQDDLGENFLWPHGQINIEDPSGSALTNVLSPFGPDESFPDLAQDAPATEQAAPTPTQKTKNRKQPNEEDAETTQAGPSKRRKTEGDCNEPNIFNVKQHVDIDMKIQAIKDYKKNGCQRNGKTKAPRTIEACNRCKAKKMKCSTDPIQCKPCRMAKEPCYHAHPITGQWYERGMDMNESRIKIWMLEQKLMEIERLRKRIEDLEKRLEEDYQDDRIGPERTQREEEEKEQRNVEDAEKLEEQKYQERYHKIYEEDKAKQLAAKEAKEAKEGNERNEGNEGNEAKKGKKPKAKAEEKGKGKEKQRSSTDQPIPKNPDQSQTQLQPSMHVHSSQQNPYVDNLNRPGTHGEPSLSTTSGYTAGSTRPDQFPGYYSNSDVTPAGSLQIKPPPTAPRRRQPQPRPRPQQRRSGPRQPLPMTDYLGEPTFIQPRISDVQSNAQDTLSQDFSSGEPQFQRQPRGRTPHQQGKRINDQPPQNTQLSQDQAPDANNSDSYADVEIGSPPFDDVAEPLSWE